MHYAAQNGWPAIVDLLLQAAADVDAQDEYGNTPLWRAVFNYRGDVAVIEKLLAAGADSTLANDHGVSPRQLSDTKGDSIPGLK